MYRCDNCGAEFDVPITLRHLEPLDDDRGWEMQAQKFCPICGWENITEVKDEPLSD